MELVRARLHNSGVRSAELQTSVPTPSSQPQETREGTRKIRILGSNQIWTVTSFALGTQTNCNLTFVLRDLKNKQTKKPHYLLAEINFENWLNSTPSKSTHRQGTVKVSELGLVFPVCPFGTLDTERLTILNRPAKVKVKLWTPFQYPHRRAILLAKRLKGTG